MVGAVVASSDLDFEKFEEFDGLRFSIERRKTSSLPEIGIDFSESGYGSFRIMQLFSKVFDLIARVFSLPTFAHLSNVLKGVYTGIGVTHVPKATQELLEVLEDKGISNKKVAPYSDPERGLLKKLKTVLDAAGTYLYAIVFLFKGTFLKGADAASFLGDLCEAKMAFQDLEKSNTLLGRAKELKNKFFENRFEDAKKDAVLRLLKAVSSVAAIVLPFLAALFGCSVSPLTLLMLGITACSSAIAHHFFTKSREIKVVQFFG